MDKAGKGTQCKLLNEYLNKNGNKSQVLDFPDYTTILGKEIRKFLDGKNNFPLQVQHMLLSANRWEKKETILNIINKGTTIIMDRYYQSNLVYGLSNGLDLEWCLSSYFLSRQVKRGLFEWVFLRTGLRRPSLPPRRWTSFWALLRSCASGCRSRSQSNFY